MRELFVIDKKNYKENSKKIIRPSARAIIIKKNKIALVHSALYDYYKFPGGGINKNETAESACIRETKEESGLVIKRDSLKPYGSVLRKEKTEKGVFIQENYYYFADVENSKVEQTLDKYESDEGFTLEWVDPKLAIEVNSREDYGKKSKAMIEREKRVLELLVEEGYFKQKFEYDFRNLLIFIPLFITDIVFHLISATAFDFSDYLRMFLFDLGISSLISIILSFFNNKKVYFIVGLIVNILFSVFAFIQLECMHLMQIYYSLTGAAGGEGAIKEFALTFIKDAKAEYWLCFLSIIVFVLIYRYMFKLKDKKQYLYHLVIPVLCAIGLFSIFSLNVNSIDLKDVYYYHTNYEAIINKLGINHFFIKDLSAFIVKPEEKEIVIIPEEKEPETETISYIDDSKWLEAIENEEDETIKQIDEYLINRTQEEKNEYSGLLEGKNFIYIMVESLDYIAIDEDLTPTLYKMYTEGMSFSNHYTPMYVCGTGDSEFVSINGLYPYTDACTVHHEQDNDYSTSLAYLFKNKGYTTRAYHNWTDEFYDRHTLLENEGFDSYKDYSDLNMKAYKGWQSDSELFELAYNEFSQDDKYFAFIITSTMHFPYTDSSYFGDKYLDVVKEKYPDMDEDVQRYLSKCIDFDKGLEYLLNKLAEDNQLDNTTICIFPDHRPYILQDDRIIAYSTNFDRTGVYGVNLSPFIIYDSTLGAVVNENVCSTIDHVPTIANLFNLNYDSRLYFGSDIFNDNCIVPFVSRNWLNKYGIYYSSSGYFNNTSGIEISKEEIDNINNKVSTYFTVSRSIIKNDYFKLRHFITNPTIKEEIIIKE